MKRMQLFELEDLPWVPTVVRDGGTDFLDFVFARIGFYRALAPKLRELLEATGMNELVDLASGGGGGALALQRALAEAGRPGVGVVFTDRHPNADARSRIAALADPRLRYHDAPVDALDGAPALSGIRTMFGALHHFRPEEVGQLVRAAVDVRVPFAFFDVAASPALRKLPAILAPLAAIPNLVALFLVTLLVTPFLRPLRVDRLPLTYALPLIPILVAWDGTVSALRAYTPEELLAIAHAVPAPHAYVFDSGRDGPALYLLGRPLEVNQGDATLVNLGS